MAIQHLSRGAQAQRDDDHVAIFSAGAMTHVLVMAGGTSVAELDDIDPIRGDVAWVVQHVTAALEEIAPLNRSQQDSVQAAIVSCGPGPIMP